MYHDAKKKMMYGGMSKKKGMMMGGSMEREKKSMGGAVNKSSTQPTYGGDVATAMNIAKAN